METLIKIGDTVITAFGEGFVKDYDENYPIGNRHEQRWLIDGGDFYGWFTIGEIKGFKTK